MSSITENQHIDIGSMLEIFRNKAQSMPSAHTSARYLRALDSFSSFSSKSSNNIGDNADNADNTANINTARSADTEPQAPILGSSTADTAVQAADTSLSILLSDWLISLWLTETPFSTASQFLDILSALYSSLSKETTLPPSPFPELKSRLRELGEDGWTRGIDETMFQRALRLTKNARHCISDDAIAVDILLWSLTHDLVTPEKAAMLTRTEFENDPFIKQTPPTFNVQYHSPEPNSNSSKRPRRSKYIFPLSQSALTPRQLEKRVRAILIALFRRVRLPISDRPFDTIESLWAYAALSLGYRASEVVAHLGHVPVGLPVLKLAALQLPTSIVASGSGSALYAVSEREYDDISNSDDNADNSRNKNTARSADTLPKASNTVEESFADNVGKAFLDNPPRWYAMSLRPGVRFTQVARRIEILADRVPRVELFYPCEDIARAIGKKIVLRQRPFIHSVVFFSARPTDIIRLFARIGDLAWCYKTSPAPGSPYAEILPSQFRLFQQTIASFTPDYEVAESGALTLHPDDRVEIIGGPFTGQLATIDSVVPITPTTRPTAADNAPTTQTLSAKRSDTAAKAADTAKQSYADTALQHRATTVYRLNLIGDNGIEWRVNVDSRLLRPV